MTTENRKVKSITEIGRWKECENFRNMELVVYGHE